MSRTVSFANRVAILGSIVLGIGSSAVVGAQTQSEGTRNSTGAQNVQAARESSDDSSDLLIRVRKKISRTTRQLLKCTCLENIERNYYVPRVEKTGRNLMTEAPPTSCEGKQFDNNARLSLDATDRLRLGVAVAGDKEIHSWAAASRFDSRSVFSLVSSGPISMGSFGTYLADIFDNPGVRFQFNGTKSQGAAEVYEYTFVVPAEASHYDIGVENGWRITGYHGLVQIYSATAELARLVAETEELPPDARMCRARTSIDYHSMLIGDEEFLIPRQSELKTLASNASETSSVTTFSGCHEYTAESSLRFGRVEPTDAKPGPQATTPLPPGISMSLALLAPVETSSAAGDAITARVLRAVRTPHSNHILLPAGAIAHGRILQMRHQYTPPQFLISIRFETLESNGMLTPLALKLDRDMRAEKPSKSSGLRNRSAEFSLPPPTSVETGGLFAITPGDGRHVLSAGFESKWITVTP
jgi:hypothetical protein